MTGPAGVGIVGASPEGILLSLPQPTGARRVELIVLLAGLTAFAPFSIDMYLPALPALAHDFAGTAAAAERTLTTFFLGFSVGQSFIGPLADRFGRKKPLYVGLTLYMLASLGCVFAPSLGALAWLRLLQALGACAGIVTARAVVRDLFAPKDAIQVLARMLLVMGVAPLLAPLAGGYVLVAFGWKAIFVILSAIGATALLAVWFRLPETHRAEHIRSSLRIGGILRDYAGLLRDRRFVAYGLGAGIANAGMFAYITGSPHVFIDVFHVAPQNYGWLFGLNACGLIGLSQANAFILKRRDPAIVLRIAHLMQATAGVLLVAAAWFGFGGLYTLLPPLFIYIALNGAVMPSATALAMAPHAGRAGLASALLGTLQFGCAALASFAVAALQGHSAVPMALVVAACAVVGTTLNLVLAPPARPPSPT
jgi:MFS transporter, DHA1 family, multidrug resistance protein